MTTMFAVLPEERQAMRARLGRHAHGRARTASTNDAADVSLMGIIGRPMRWVVATSGTLYRADETPR